MKLSFALMFALFALAITSKVATDAAFLDEEVSFVDEDPATNLQQSVAARTQRLGSCANVKSQYQAAVSRHESAIRAVEAAQKLVNSCPRPGVLTAQISSLQSRLNAVGADLKTLNEIRSFVRSKVILSEKQFAALKTLAAASTSFVEVEKLSVAHHGRLDTLIVQLIKELEGERTAATNAVNSLTVQRNKCNGYETALAKAQAQAKAAKEERESATNVYNSVTRSHICSTSGRGSSTTQVCETVEKTLHGEKSEIDKLTAEKAALTKQVNSCPKAGVLSTQINDKRKEMTAVQGDIKTLHEIRDFVKSKATLSEAQKARLGDLLANSGAVEFVEVEKLSTTHHSRLQQLIADLINELTAKRNQLDRAISSLTTQRATCDGYRAKYLSVSTRLTQVSKSYSSNLASWDGVMKLCQVCTLGNTHHRGQCISQSQAPVWRLDGNNAVHKNSRRGSLATTTSFSVSFWYRPTRVVAPWSNIFHVGSSDAVRAPAVWQYPGSTRLHIRVRTQNNHNNGCDPSQTLTLHAWTHVAFTVHANEMSVYYNGKKVCTTNLGSSAVSAGTQPVYVSDPWYTSAEGAIANLRFWNRELPYTLIEKNRGSVSLSGAQWRAVPLSCTTRSTSSNNAGVIHIGPQSGYTLVSGGVSNNYRSNNQLAVFEESFPDGNNWRCDTGLGPGRLSCYSRSCIFPEHTSCVTNSHATNNAGVVRVGLPSGYTMLGGGMNNRYRSFNKLSVFEEMFPEDNAYRCDMGIGSGHITCYSRGCKLPGNYRFRCTTRAEHRNSSGILNPMCPSGYIMVGGGVYNHHRNFDAKAVFEESFPSGNGWRCDMGLGAGNFHCYVRCCAMERLH